MLGGSLDLFSVTLIYLFFSPKVRVRVRRERDFAETRENTDTTNVIQSLNGSQNVVDTILFYFVCFFVCVVVHVII